MISLVQLHKTYSLNNTLQCNTVYSDAGCKHGIRRFEGSDAAAGGLVPEDTLHLTRPPGDRKLAQHAHKFPGERRVHASALHTRASGVGEREKLSVVQEFK